MFRGRRANACPLFVGEAFAAAHALQSRFLFVEVGEAGSCVGCFIQESPVTAGLSNRSGKEDQLMVQLLVKVVHAFFGESR